MKVYSGYGRGNGMFAQLNAPRRSLPLYRSLPITATPSKNIQEGLRPWVSSYIEEPEIGSHTAEITGLRCIGSYNWVADTRPTIIVPGSPPIWIHKRMPFQVNHDQNNPLILEDGHRLPSCDLLPLFKAVDVVRDNHTGFEPDWKNVDFITNRNGLRKLLRWIMFTEGTCGRSIPDFRLDLQLAGDRTVLLNRWEKDVFAPPGLGYGFGFEQATTKLAPGCERSTGHHRIVQYDFGGMNMVVRFEVDACIETLVDDEGFCKATGRKTVSSSLLPLRQTSFGTTSGVDVNVIRAGQLVPQSSLLEMTTRSERFADQYRWEENYPQLYLSQTPHHMLAIHRGGRFHRTESRMLDDAEMRAIHTQYDDVFKKLRALLGTIQRLVVARGKEGRLSLVCRRGLLAIYEREDRESCLPEAVMNRFDSRVEDQGN